MPRIPTYEEAYEILAKYNTEDFHLTHGKTVGEVMAYFAQKRDPENQEYWRIVGLLHDVDFGMYPDQHCVKAEEILRDHDIDPALIYSVTSHGYGMTDTPNKPEKEMEKVLYAVDELTGIIGAAALMRPSKSTLDMELKSLKKKFKDKKFAAGCDRDVIRQGAENLGMDLDALMEETLEAMKEMERKQAV